MTCACNTVNLNIYANNNNTLQSLFDKIPSLEEKIKAIKDANALSQQKQSVLKATTLTLLHSVTNNPSNIVEYYNDRHLGFIGKLLKRGVIERGYKTWYSSTDLYAVHSANNTTISALQSATKNGVGNFVLTDDDVAILVDIYKKYDQIQQYITHVYNLLVYSPTVGDSSPPFRLNSKNGNIEEYTAALNTLKMYKEFLQSLEPVPVEQLQNIISLLTRLNNVELSVLLGMSNNFPYSENWDTKVPELINEYRTSNPTDSDTVGDY